MSEGKSLDGKNTSQEEMTHPKTVPPMVLVIWEDAKVIDSGETWVDNKPAEYKPHLFHQVGFLTLMNDDGLHLTAAWSDDQIARRDQIPRAMVRSITYLEPTLPKPKSRRNRAEIPKR